MAGRTTKAAPRKPAPSRAPATRAGDKRAAALSLILDATEQLMLDEGYPAISTRRVAAQAGIKAPLIHYYFPTTDDLVVAVYRRVMEQHMQRLEQALASPRPLTALWTFASDSSRNTFAVELLALANRRPAIREEIKFHTERTRQRQAELLAKLLGRDADATATPLVMAILMAGVARVLVMESSVGISLGHAQARAFVERWLAQHEPP